MSDTSKKPASANLDIKQLTELAKWLETTGLEEVEVETSGTRIRLRKPGMNVVHTAPTSTFAAPAAAPSAAAAPTQANENAFKSPMVGTFYRATSPESPPLVKEGDTVSVGQTLGIIEAMKTMNQIESDRAGIITKILVSNAQAVEYGQPMFIIQ